MPSLVSGIENNLAVRRKARGFVQTAFSQQLRLSADKILRRDIEMSPIALHEHKRFTIRRKTRRYVVRTVERQSLRVTTVDQHAIDLRAAPAIGSKQNGLTVRRKIG